MCIPEKKRERLELELENMRFSEKGYLKGMREATEKSEARDELLELTMGDVSAM